MLDVMMSEALPSRIPVGVAAPEALAASLKGLKLLLIRRALAAGRGDRSAALWLGSSMAIILVSLCMQAAGQALSGQPLFEERCNIAIASSLSKLAVDARC